MRAKYVGIFEDNNYEDHKLFFGETKENVLKQMNEALDDVKDNDSITLYIASCIEEMAVQTRIISKTELKVIPK